MSEITEAVTAATAGNTGQLIAKFIDPLIVEYVRRLSPLVATIPTKQITTNNYYWNQETARPSGGAVQDGGARAISYSTFTQNNFLVKNFQAVGQITKFAQAVTAGVVGDLYRQQIDSAMKNLTWSVETALLYGHENATINGQYPTAQGLDYQVSTFSGSTQNAVDQAGSTLTLAMLDQLIDLVEVNARDLGTADVMFVCSTTTASKIAQLSVANQRFANTVEASPGLNVLTYRDIPLVKSSFLASRSNSVGAVTSATATTTGTLAAATYYYRVAAIVDRFGEIAASTEISQTTTGSTSTVTLTLPTVNNIDGATPILYKVYRSTATGTESLLGVVDAYDTGGTATATIKDTGANLETNSTALTSQTTYQGTNAGAKPRGTAQEDIYLIPRNGDFLVRPYVRDFFAQDLAATTSAPDVLPFYIQSDTCLAIRDPKYVARLARVGVSL